MSIYYNYSIIRITISVIILCCSIIITKKIVYSYKYIFYSYLNKCTYTILNIYLNNSFSLQQISETGNLESYLISRQHKLNLMTDFMRLTNENPKLKQSEIANQLGYSSSTLQRYRSDMNMLSPCRFQSNKRTKKASNTIFNNSSQRKPDVKGPQMTLKQLKQRQN